MPIKRNPILVGLLVLCLTSWQWAMASIVDDLYDAKVAVNDQSERTQSRAFSAALKEVLLKVRGNRDLLADRQIKKLITQARGLVRSYRYDVENTQLFLVISFDPQRVDEAIRSAGFPIWDKRRPDTLVWLALEPEKDESRQIATTNKYPEIYQQLALAAKQRGIKLIFPLWDLIDLQNLGIYDIWGGFSSQIGQASERYAVQSVLSARIYQNDNELKSESNQQTLSNTNNIWVADWTMIESGRLQAGEVQHTSILGIAQNLVDTLADQLSVKYAIDMSQTDNVGQKVQIVINNIESLTHYHQALVLLGNLSVVANATLIKQQGTTATYELVLLGGQNDLVNALGLDSKIRPVVDDFGQPIGELTFFWVK